MMGMDKKISELRFVDPISKKPLFKSKKGLVDKSGKLIAKEKNGKLLFLNEKTIREFEQKRDQIDVIKSFLKSIFGKHYKILIWIISPHMPRIHWSTRQTYLTYIVHKFSDHKKVVINLGSGNDRYNNKIINLDMFPLKEVNVVASAEQLPFADNSVDGIINTELLEHVSDPRSVLKEAYRVLKHNGFIITAVPFIESFHGSPEDFYRWFSMGIVHLHEDVGFKVKDVVPLAGPTASLISITQTWLALVFSFNIEKLYYFWFIFLSIFLVPFKILDLFLIKSKMSYNLNASNLYIGKK